MKMLFNILMNLLVLCNLSVSVFCLLTARIMVFVIFDCFLILINASLMGYYITKLIEEMYD
jgi:hypothetical protein